MVLNNSVKIDGFFKNVKEMGGWFKFWSIRVTADEMDKNMYDLKKPKIRDGLISQFNISVYSVEADLRDLYEGDFSNTKADWGKKFENTRSNIEKQRSSFEEGCRSSTDTIKNALKKRWGIHAGNIKKIRRTTKIYKRNRGAVK